MLFAKQIACISILAILVGCETSEPVSSPVRPPPARVSVPPPQMELALREAARSLAVQLPALRAVREARTKLVLAVGPVQNASSIFQRDLENHVERLQALLLDNEAIRNNFVVMGTPYDDAQRVLHSIQPVPSYEFEDPAGPTGAAGPRKYPPDIIYVLSLRAYESSAGDASRRTVQLSVRVEHPISRSMVYASEQAARLEWDPDRLAWVAVDPR